MEQGHLIPAHGKEGPSDPPATQMTSNFPEIGFHFPDQWHPQRPTKLNQLDIFTDELPIKFIYAFQPFPNWLTPRSRAEKDDAKNGA
jgi:hypothetical protein